MRSPTRRATKREKARVWKAWGLFDRAGDLVVVKVSEKPYKCCDGDSIGPVRVTRYVPSRPAKARRK